MRHLSKLVLVLPVALILVLAGEGAASATVLCKNEACTETYPAGTLIKAELSGTAVFKSGESIFAECSHSTIEAETESGGGPTQTVAAKKQGESWSICSDTVLTVKTGVLELHAIPKTFDSVMTGRGGEITIHNTLAGSCSYATGTGITLGKYTAGDKSKLPKLDITAPKMKKSAGGAFCPAEMEWEAEYLASSPVPVYFQ